MNKRSRLLTAIFNHSPYIYKFINGPSDDNIDINPSASVGRNTQLEGNITIQSDVSIAWNCVFRGDVKIEKGTNFNGHNTFIGDISVGKYCAIAPRARVRTNDHPTEHPALQVGLFNKIGADMTTADTGGKVTIGNDVWLCADSKVVSGVNIGNGAIIAANSVVTNDVEPYSLVAGNPAKHKKYRFDQSTINALQEIEWWNWSDKKMSQNIEFFESNLNECDNIWELVSG